MPPVLTFCTIIVLPQIAADPGSLLPVLFEVPVNWS
jgi:hypothetical protein